MQSERSFRGHQTARRTIPQLAHVCELRLDLPTGSIEIGSGGLVPVEELGFRAVFRVAGLADIVCAGVQSGQWGRSTANLLIRYSGPFPERTLR